MARQGKHDEGPGMTTAAASASASPSASNLTPSADARRSSEQERSNDLYSLTFFPGAHFSGCQTSNTSTYLVDAVIHVIDWEHGICYGDLSIYDLTPQLPALTTCFQGDIIGLRPGVTFQTERWHAVRRVDIMHWRLLSGFGMEFMDNPEAYDPRTSRYIFMRWKEHFVVDNPDLRYIEGASFSGFYYICFDRKTGAIEGFYYSPSSEKYQKLKLKLTRGLGPTEFVPL